MAVSHRRVIGVAGWALVMVSALDKVGFRAHRCKGCRLIVSFDTLLKIAKRFSSVVVITSS
jgi:hypothetical protein